MVNRNESLAEFKYIIENDNGIEIKTITTRNPQANVKLEQVHHTIVNIMSTF